MCCIGEVVPTHMLAKQVGDEGRWRDLELDLGGFAGTDVELVLGSDAAAAGNVALWSNPVVYTPGPPSAGTGQRPRNVLLYLIDCLRADHLEAYGYGRQLAPRIRCAWCWR